jgi:hypothetical protein
MYKFLQTLHPGGIRTRDLFCSVGGRGDHYATPPGHLLQVFAYLCHRGDESDDEADLLIPDQLPGRVQAERGLAQEAGEALETVKSGALFFVLQDFVRRHYICTTFIICIIHRILSYRTLSDGTLFYIEHLPSRILSYWTFSTGSLFYLKHLTCTILSQGTLSEETMSFLQHITHRILSFMTLFDGTSYFVRMSYVQPTYSI